MTDAEMPRYNKQTYEKMSRKKIEKIKRNEKRGSVEDGTDAAHMLGHELAQGVLKHRPGRKATASTVDTVERMQSSRNSRLKSATGNRVTDRRNDAAILEKRESGARLTTTEAKRAVQAYKGCMAVCKGNATLEYVAKDIGEMTMKTGRPGRPPKVKNLAKRGIR